jgi:hypothetical protein
MTTTDQARRKRIWERHVLRGEPREEVVPEIATEFGVDEVTVEEDLVSIDDWLPKLDEFRKMSGIALVVELRANRQQLHQLADQARDDEEITQERKIRQEINRSINFERQLHEADMKTKPTSADLGLEELIGE